MEKRTGKWNAGKRKLVFVFSLLAVLAAVLAITPWLCTTASAFDTWSTNRTSGNCADCHGNFRSATYTSLVDRSTWSNGLHDGHRTTMLSSDCNVCHVSTRFPVSTSSSTGGTGFTNVSCLGCHGRLENGPGGPGMVTGTGLRQHHIKNGVPSCATSTCHSSENPLTYTPVAENVLPPYYFTPDAAHPNKPTNPCNTGGNTESKVGSSLGLDNDGNDLFDLSDSSCGAPAPDTTPPVVSITAPSASATVSGTVSVTANATDTGGSGVAGVQFKLDGVNLGAEDTTSPYSVSWNTTTAANGSHTLTAVARDVAGNTTTSASVTVTVNSSSPDKKLPKVTITNPTSKFTYSTQSSVLSIAGTASDEGGITQVNWSNNRGSSGSCAGTTSWSYNEIPLSVGRNVITVTALDRAGNAGKDKLTVTYTHVFGMEDWEETWFEVHVEFDEQRPTVGLEEEDDADDPEVKDFLKLSQWDPDNQIFQATLYLHDPENGGWSPVPMTLQYISGTPINFQFWSEMDGDVTYGFTGRIRGRRSGGVLKSATVKSLDGYYAEASSQAASGRLEIEGKLIPETQVPEDIL